MQKLFFPPDDATEYLPLSPAPTTTQLLQWLADRSQGKLNITPEKVFLKIGDFKPVSRAPVPTPPSANASAGKVITGGKGLVKVVSRFFTQRDSTTGHEGRSCFSSCSAMMAATINSKLFPGANDDDIYLRYILEHGGDTVNASDQTWALGKFGIQASMRFDLDVAVAKKQLARGIPIPIGTLHHGYYTRPNEDASHYILLYGIDEDNFYCHDPYGILDQENGVWLNTTPGCGKSVVYPRKFVEKRWMVGGSGGWGIIAEPLKK